MIRHKVLVLILATASLTAGCSFTPGSDEGNQPTLPFPAVGVSTAGIGKAPATIKFSGSCANNGIIRVQVTGFTPNGKYVAAFTGPDGRAYTYVSTAGITDANGQLLTVRADGSIVPWGWDCNVTPNGIKDPEGTYMALFTDVTDPQHLVSLSQTFEIKY